MHIKIRVLFYLLLSTYFCLFSAFSQANNLTLGIYKLNRGEFHTAIEQFKPLVIEGYAPAQYQMAIIYLQGYGVPKDSTKALELLRLAAKQNYVNAQFELALIYSEGKLVKQNLKKAFLLTSQAAKKDLASAQFNLAVMYANGTGVKQNYFKASRWYQAAADQNYALAQYNLALLYSEGKGVEQSTEMSYIWNTISGWNGYPDANRSRMIDEQQLSSITKQRGYEKANEIYKKIKEQGKLKVEMSENKSLY